MGDPKFPRRRYDTPSHPWNAERIATEKGIVRKYGLKNKREVWKAQTRLRSFRGVARGLIAQQHTPTPQVTKESSQLLKRMNRLGLLSEGSTLDDVLALDVESVLARRLQTVVYLKGLSSTPQQARQFIVHGHVTIDGRKVTVPSYIVAREEEDAIELRESSALADPMHPVRSRPETVVAPREDRRGAAPAPAPETPSPEDEDSDAKIPDQPAAEADGAKEGGESA